METDFVGRTVTESGPGVGLAAILVPCLKTECHRCPVMVGVSMIGVDPPPSSPQSRNETARPLVTSEAEDGSLPDAIDLVGPNSGSGLVGGSRNCVDQNLRSYPPVALQHRACHLLPCRGSIPLTCGRPRRILACDPVALCYHMRPESQGKLPSAILATKPKCQSRLMPLCTGRGRRFLEGSQVMPAFTLSRRQVAAKARVNVA